MSTKILITILALVFAVSACTPPVPGQQVPITEVRDLTVQVMAEKQGEYVETRGILGSEPRRVHYTTTSVTIDGQTGQPKITTKSTTYYIYWLSDGEDNMVRVCTGNKHEDLHGVEVWISGVVTEKYLPNSEGGKSDEKGYCISPTWLLAWDSIPTPTP